MKHLQAKFARGRQSGFTMIELMIVIAIILILVGMAVPNYQRHLLSSREATLKQDLFSMRQCIDQYTLDKQKAPQSLHDLISAGYLRQMPKDPFTHSDSTWTTTNEDTLMAVDQSAPGIVDVHSGSNATSSDGSAYSSW